MNKNNQNLPVKNFDREMKLAIQNNNFERVAYLSQLKREIINK